MNKIDLTATLVVRIALIIAGVGLVYSGGQGLLADMMMYQVLGAGQMSMMWPFFGLHLAQTLGGLAILGFATVGILRAIRQAREAGEPGVPIGPAEPLTLKRIASAGAFGLGALFGIVTLAPAIVPMAEVASFSLFGTPIEASIDRFTEGPDNDSKIVHYYFRVSGQNYTGARPVNLNTWSRTLRTKRIDVVFMANDPRQNDLADPNGLQRVGFFLITRIGLTLVGIWGVWKNLRPTYTSFGPAEPAAPIEPRSYAPAAPAPRPAPPRAGAPRASFGKRGA